MDDEDRALVASALSRHVTSGREPASRTPDPASRAATAIPAIFARTTANR
jgi:hypothetical protein